MPPREPLSAGWTGLDGRLARPGPVPVEASDGYWVTVVRRHGLMNVMLIMRARRHDLMLVMVDRRCVLMQLTRSDPLSDRPGL